MLTEESLELVEKVGHPFSLMVGSRLSIEAIAVDELRRENPVALEVERLVFVIGDLEQEELRTLEVVGDRGHENAFAIGRCE